jgi:phage tail sheath protein FI
VKVFDPVTELPKSIPPGGHIAGIYARTDQERGVHKAPANEVVRGATDVDILVTKGDQDILNPKGVNAIRVFPGRGIRVWGARNMILDPLWKYINVRRLFIFLEESIDEGTQSFVFEPNDEKLWDRVRQTITQFLTRVWRDGALMGTTPEQAFFVKVDRTTMTQDDIDNGRLIVLIGVAPVKPAEFVIFRIAQTRGGAEVAEA